MLGYDVKEDARTFEKEGLTGVVRQYTTTDMKYPCYVVQITPECPVERYKLTMLRQMFTTGSVVDPEIAGLAINVYFSQGSKTACLGRIYPKQVKSFLKLFEGNLVDGYFNADTLLSGDYLYALA